MKFLENVEIDNNVMILMQEILSVQKSSTFYNPTSSVAKGDKTEANMFSENTLVDVNTFLRFSYLREPLRLVQKTEMKVMFSVDEKLIFLMKKITIIKSIIKIHFGSSVTRLKRLRLSKSKNYGTNLDF